MRWRDAMSESEIKLKWGVVVTIVATAVIFFLGSLQMRLSAQEQCASENTRNIAVLQQQFSSEMYYVRRSLDEIKVAISNYKESDGKNGGRETHRR